VIVGSILLAFAVDAWWDDRREGIDAADLARDLLVDVRASRQNADSIRSYTRERFEALMEVRDLLRSAEPSVPMDSLNQRLLEGLAIDRTTPVLDAYAQLVSRGLISRLHPEVRSGISAWLQLQTDIGQYGEQDMLDYRQNIVFPLFSRPPFAMEQLLVRYYDLGEWGPPRFDHSWADLHESEELAAILITSAASTRYVLDLYERLDLRAAELEEALVRHYRPDG
jgi:hypothetical protein